MSATADAVRILSHLAELGMSIVERLHDKAMVAEDAGDIVALNEAFCDAGRGVRQSIALQLRLEGGAFGVQRAPSRAAESDPDAEPGAREEPSERPERGDWYERPDYETALRLTGDPAQDEAAIQEAVATAVTRIRNNYAKAEAVLVSPAVRPASGLAALLAGAAPLIPVDSS